MQIALQASAFGVGSFDDSSPGLLDLMGLVGRLSPQRRVLRGGWVLGSVGVATNLLLTYLILLLALRFVGVSATQLSSAGAFAAFAVAFWAGAVFPITGSGLGVVDAVLVTVPRLGRDIDPEPERAAREAVAAPPPHIDTVVRLWLS